MMICPPLVLHTEDLHNKHLNYKILAQDISQCHHSVKQIILPYTTNALSCQIRTLYSLYFII